MSTQIEQTQTIPTFLDDDTPLSLETQMALCGVFVAKYQQIQLESPTITLLAEQNDLLRTLRTKLNPKNIQTLDTQEDEGPVQDLSPVPRFFSQLHVASKTNILDSSFQTVRTRRSRLSNSSHEVCKAFDEVYEKCSRQTYAILYKLSNECKYSIQKSSKVRQIEQELSRMQEENAILRQKHDEQMKLVESLHEKLQALFDEKNAKVRAAAEKQKQLAKLETGLLIKDKLLNQNKKTLNNKWEVLRAQENALAEERRQVQHIWEQLFENEDPQSQEGRLLNKKLYLKCKEALLKQRKSLLAQQKQIDTQHETLYRFIGQLRALQKSG